MAVLTIHFNSKTLRLATAARIIIPSNVPRSESPDYEALYGAKGRLPVLWLLHGGGDNYTDWNNYTKVQFYADEYGYAVVMPDAQTSSYANMAYGPNWLDFYMNELPEYMYSRFPLSRERCDNFISGMSMGGYGTVKFALLQPERFSVAVPLASAVEVPKRYAESRWERVPGGAPQPGKQHMFNDIYGFADDPKKVLGTQEDCYYLLKKAVEEGKELPRFLHCQGTEDHTYNGNVEYRAYAESLGVHLDWIEAPGMHDWDSWNLYLPEVFKYIKKCREEMGVE
ncbi:MAG: hypothetical protein IJL78_01325 [Lachnospiraceae bacterium]|nr:hypothetical protein [Lachnospiraceae bacterium]